MPEEESPIELTFETDKGEYRLGRRVVSVLAQSEGDQESPPRYFELFIPETPENATSSMCAAIEKVPVQEHGKPSRLKTVRVFSANVEMKDRSLKIAREGNGEEILRIRVTSISPLLGN